MSDGVSAEHLCRFPLVHLDEGVSSRESPFEGPTPDQIDRSDSLIKKKCRKVFLLVKVLSAWKTFKQQMSRNSSFLSLGAAHRRTPSLTKSDGIVLILWAIPLPSIHSVTNTESDAVVCSLSSDATPLRHWCKLGSKPEWCHCARNCLFYSSILNWCSYERCGCSSAQLSHW